MKGLSLVLMLMALHAAKIYADGLPMQFIELAECTEIRLTPVPHTQAWHTGSPHGGLNAYSVQQMQVLEAEMGKDKFVPIGKMDSPLKLQLNKLGHNLPAYDDNKFNSYGNYWLTADDDSNTSFAEALLAPGVSAHRLSTGEPVPSGQLPNVPDQDLYFISDVYFADFYFGPEQPAAAKVNCAYAGPNAQETLQNLSVGQCAWIDSSSLSKSGKKFCLSDGAIFRANDRTDMEILARKFANRH